jgi:hypothetical protein
MVFTCTTQFNMPTLCILPTESEYAYFIWLSQQTAILYINNLESETVKCGHESCGTRAWERLRWRGSAAIVNDRPILSSERMLKNDYNRKCSVEKKIMGASLMGLVAKTNWLAVNRQFKVTHPLKCWRLLKNVHQLTGCFKDLRDNAQVLPIFYYLHIGS